MVSQNEEIKESIKKLIESGMKDKSIIYTKVVEELGVPRATVRRVASQLHKELLAKTKTILHAEKVFPLVNSG